VSVPPRFLRDDFARRWEGRDPFEQIAAVATTPVREVARRKTFRFELDGVGYYAKVHRGVGWREIIKNWLVGKAPVLDASNEFRAATKLAQVGLDTLQVAAFGVRGRNPARRDSFLVTDEITDTVTLEAYTLPWPDQPPEPQTKRALISKVADVARAMHGAGVNHRDFYICHLLLKNPHLLTPAGENVTLYVVDLHRAQLRSRVPRRWLVRDLGGLYYSTFDINLSRGDRLRFLSRYFQLPVRELLRRHRTLLDAVERRATKLYAKAERNQILPRQLAKQRH
jgi:heptose I phosphotransferase